MLACGYALGVAGWSILVRTPAAGWWPINLASVFDLWLYAPLPFLALLAAARLDWRAALWLFLPFLVLGGEYGPYFLPNGVTASGTPLRILTANLTFTNPNVEVAADVLAGQRPDVIAVQELGPTMADTLARRLREHYPYQALYPRQGALGMGVLSRYPLAPAGSPEMSPGSCNCLEASFDLDGQSVTLLIVHPAPPESRFTRALGVPVPTRFDTSRHERSLGAILDRASAVREPLLVVGDFNLSDRQPAYSEFRQRFGDAHREAGWGLGYTFPNEKVYRLPFYPFLRIDYVLHDAAWSASSARTGDLAGSDHRFVVADLILLER